jgi:biopolymer transport protein ExbB/TolQ
MVKVWIELTQWITTLSDRKISIFLLSMLVTALGYSRWELQNENNRLVNRVDNLTNSRDSILSDSRKKSTEIERIRIKALEESNEYWRTKFEKMEEQMHRQYEEIKGIKSKSR